MALLTVPTLSITKSKLKCPYDQIVDFHFLHFRLQYDFLTHLAKFQSIMNIRSHSFFTFISDNLRPPLPRSKAWLRIRENDVICAKIPHGLKL